MKIFSIAALGVLLGIAGCGGGGGDGDVAPPAVPSGQLDPGYGSRGRVDLADGPMLTLVARDGSAFLVAGNSVWKLDSAGARVTSYGQAGEVRFEPAFGTNGAASARGDVFATLNSGLAKVDPDGRFDPAFGVNGVGSLGLLERGISPLGIGLDDAGNAYLIGHRVNQPVETKVILKVDGRGLMVGSYGLSGIVDVVAAEVTIDARGSGYLASAVIEPRSGETRVLVDKLDASGSTSADFTRALGELCVFPNIVAPVVDASGNVLVGATCGVGNSRRAMLFKLGPGGAPIPLFRSGIRPDIFGGSADGSFTDEVTSLATGANGDIFVGGSHADLGSQCPLAMVAKLDSAGNPVRSFGAEGVAVLSPSLRSTVVDVALDGFQRLYVGVAGSTFCASPPGVRPAHYVYRMGP